MAPETVGRLAAHPNIAGIKETSTDGAQFTELAGVVPERFSVLAGSAPGAYTAFCAGAAGAILAVACVRPRLCLRLRSSILEGRHADALAIQQRLTPLARAVTTGFGIAGLKAALDLSGLEGGDPRPPLGPLSSDAIERIRTLLNDTAD
jgi:4-hydroxy-2-oxoglutarate aldolase